MDCIEINSFIKLIKRYSIKLQEESPNLYEDYVKDYIEESLIDLSLLLEEMRNEDLYETE